MVGFVVLLVLLFFPGLAAMAVIVMPIDKTLLKSVIARGLRGRRRRRPWFAGGVQAASQGTKEAGAFQHASRLAVLMLLLFTSVLYVGLYL